MSGVTVAFAGSGPQAPLTWLFVSDGGRVRESCAGDLFDLAASADGEVIIVVPGTEVTAHAIAIAARSERQAREAAPFAVEDRLASDLDELHLALLPEERRADTDPVRTVLVTSRALMDQWTRAVQEAGLSMTAIVPDYLLLPVQEGRASLASFEDRLLLRDGQWGAAIDAGMPGEFAEALIAQRDLEPDRLALGTDELRAAMAANARAWGPILLSGDYGTRHEGGAGTGLPWRSLAAAAGVLVALLIGQNVITGIGLSQQAEQIEAEAERRFRALYPEVGEVRNLRAQIRERAGADGGGQPAFLVLSSALAAAMEDHPELEIDFVRYNADSGEMTSSVFFSDYDDFAGFRERVEALGVVFEEGGSQQAGRRRAGNFTMRLAP
jgi:general secretion pathway protein L